MADYDLIIIGGGSAGLTAATIAGRVGARVLLVDKERLGGDCLYYGCVPSKALLAAVGGFVLVIIIQSILSSFRLF